jgi:osomolarity two-component system sensor histidine kinase NIK1
MNFNSQLSILLVEDNDLNQKLMKISLTRYNYSVTIAVHGLEGVQIFKIQKFDLILMDIMMPVMDGFEATKEIRKIESQNIELGYTPIIAFTANTINNDRDKCIKGGMDDILEKPFDINKFRSIVNSLP